MIVTHKCLPRRTVLRGFGATLALPLLDAMVPALAARTAVIKPARRLSVVYVGMGMNMAEWTPRSAGALQLSTIQEPLARFRDRMVVVSGLDSRSADEAAGGPHPRAQAAWATGVRAVRTEGVAEAGISMDQIAAKTFGSETPLGSLELAMEPQILGSCSAGYSCAYMNTIAWRASTTPLPMEHNPRAVFERLFGISGTTDPGVRRGEAQKGLSILDSVSHALGSLERSLGIRDRARVAEYVDAVRDVERQLQKTEEQSSRELPLLEQPEDTPSSYSEHAKLMFDLLTLAYQTDLTRVSTFMLAREASMQSYPEIGVPDTHHPLSHHGNDPNKLARLAKINTFHVSLLAYFLEKLQSIPDGEGTLLDHNLFLFGSGMSDPNHHVNHNVPTLVVAGDAKMFDIKGGRHLQVADGTPLANLQLRLLERLGVRAERFGDSSGDLPLADL